MITIGQLIGIKRLWEKEEYDSKCNKIGLSDFERFLFILIIPIIIILSLLLDVLFCFIEIPYFLFLLYYYRNRIDELKFKFFHRW